MKLQKFLNFEKKKLILPVLLIAIIVIPLYSFISIGQLENKYSCRLNDIALQLKDVAKQSNATQAVLDQIKLRANIVTVLREMAQDTVAFKDLQPITLTLINASGPLEKIMPYPCEFYPEKPFCQYYSSQKAYECAKQAVSLQPEFSNTIGFTQSKDYTYDAYLVVIMLVGAIVLAGYMISSLILLAAKNKN